MRQVRPFERTATATPRLLPTSTIKPGNTGVARVGTSRLKACRQAQKEKELITSEAGLLTMLSYVLRSV